MQIKQSRGGHSPLEKRPLAWPSYPDAFATLLTAVGVAGIFLGMGTLTAQGWVTWVGLLASAGVLLSHLVRHRQASQRRARTQEAMRAHLISQCRSLGGSTFMKQYNDGTEPVVLALTDDALHIGHRDPLEIFATLPLYDIDEVELGQVDDPKWTSEEMQQSLGTERDVLNLAVRMSGQKLYRLAFCQFERHTPPVLWAETLRKMLVHSEDGMSAD